MLQQKAARNRTEALRFFFSQVGVYMDSAYTYICIVRLGAYVGSARRLEGKTSARWNGNWDYIVVYRVLGARSGKSHVTTSQCPTVDTKNPA